MNRPMTHSLLGLAAICVLLVGGLMPSRTAVAASPREECQASCRVSRVSCNDSCNMPLTGMADADASIRQAMNACRKMCKTSLGQCMAKCSKLSGSGKAPAGEPPPPPPSTQRLTVTAGDQGVSATVAPAGGGAELQVEVDNDGVRVQAPAVDVPPPPEPAVPGAPDWTDDEVKGFRGVVGMMLGACCCGSTVFGGILFVVWMARRGKPRPAPGPPAAPPPPGAPQGGSSPPPGFGP